MEQLTQQMKIVLANVFTFYLEAQFNFPQLHEFFGNLYEAVHASVDDIAEHIRALDEYAPGTLGRFKELTEIREEIKLLSDKEMIAKLLIDNDKVIKSLDLAFKFATEADTQGLANFLSERIDAHHKHQWMLKSILK